MRTRLAYSGRVRRLFSGTAAPRSSHADLRRGTPALALPFAVVAGIGLLAVLLPPYERPWWVAGLAVLSLVPVVRGLPREPASSRALVARSGGCLPSVPLRRPRSTTRRVPGAGGSASGMTVLLLLPILWLAITGTPHQLWVASALAVLTFAIPIVVIGPPSYAFGDWRRAVVWAAVDARDRARPPAHRPRPRAAEAAGPASPTSGSSSSSTTPRTASRSWTRQA